MDEKRAALLSAMGYSDKAISFILEKTNIGEIKDASISAKDQGTCGDIMILYLDIEDQLIKDAKYDYIGCAGLQAAASALTEMIIGKNISEVEKVESKDILNYLNGLPQQKHECALLASNTLKKALKNYREKKQS